MSVLLGRMTFRKLLSLWSFFIAACTYCLVMIGKELSEKTDFWSLSKLHLAWCYNNYNMTSLLLRYHIPQYYFVCKHLIGSYSLTSTKKLSRDFFSTSQKNGTFISSSYFWHVWDYFRFIDITKSWKRFQEVNLTGYVEII